MEPQPKILIVDDKPENLYTLEKILRRLAVEVIQTTTGVEALALALEHDFFAAVVDVQMPEMDGYELVELLRGNESTMTLPVIFVSAIYSDEYHHRKAYDAGAVDFLSKPFVPEVLISKVRVFLDLYRQRQQLQSLVTQLHTVNEELSKFAAQLKVGARFSQQTTSILDVQQLLGEAVSLIRAGFDSYCVGVWLLAPESSTILLEACCQSGPATVTPGYTISLGGENSIIAHVCREAVVYLAEDVRSDPFYRATDQLPHTVAELAIPLKIGTKLLGALDIQSERLGAFAPTTVDALQIMADQLAIAIRNARLYAEVKHFNAELEDRVRARTSELEQAYLQLEMLDRNKSAFIQIISHELRTPLSLVKGFSQILLREPVLAEDAGTRMQVEGIANGAERMHEIVNRMLDVVRIDSDTLELKPIWLLLQDLLRALGDSLTMALAGRHLTLTLDPTLHDLPEIFGDFEALTKLFSNLLYNAIKYTPDGGAIMVSGQSWPATDADPSASFVEIVVSDTGIGVDPKVQELIFTKFYQTGPVAFHSSGKTKFKGGGAGLGLSIARGIVEAHGGRIWVESEGHDEQRCPGSKFHVVLPVKQSLATRDEINAQINRA
ncbi:MAG TPA: response regulator [Anaerolineae bacterium]|nr:response regulator [Anaerolineae bacterium]